MHRLPSGPRERIVRDAISTGAADVAIVATNRKWVRGRTRCGTVTSDGMNRAVTNPAAMNRAAMNRAARKGGEVTRVAVKDAGNGGGRTKRAAMTHGGRIRRATCRGGMKSFETMHAALTRRATCLVATR